MKKQKGTHFTADSVQSIESKKACANFEYDTHTLFGRLYAGAKKSKLLSKSALGEGFGESVVRYTYGKLFEDSIALASIIASESSGCVLLCAGGMYETALTILACSRLSRKLILTDENISPEDFISVLNTTRATFVISVGRLLPLIPKETKCIDVSSICAAVTGEIASPLQCRSVSRITEDDFSLCFITNESQREYSTSAIVFSAEAFAKEMKLSRFDTLLSTFEPHSPVGVICGLLSPMLSLGTTILCKEKDIIMTQMRLSMPTRLFCTADIAAQVTAALRFAAISSKVSLPVLSSSPPSEFQKLMYKLFPDTRRALRRRMCARLLMQVGGALKGVMILGRAESYLSKALESLGLFSFSVLSVDGCPYVGASFDNSPIWKLPRGLLPELCSVGKGGRGVITLSGPGIRTELQEPKKHSCIVGELRFDECDGISLVTPLKGYVCPDGSLFVEE